MSCLTATATMAIGTVGIDITTMIVAGISVTIRAVMDIDERFSP
jgi:hypothetical protein